MVEMSAPASMPHGTTAPRLRILLAEEQAAARDLVALALSRLHYQIEQRRDRARRPCPRRGRSAPI